MSDENTASNAVPQEENKEEVKPEEVATPVAEEVKTEDNPATPEASQVEVPKKFVKLVEEIEKMSVLELNELVKVLEKKFGVSAVAMAAPVAGGDAGDAEEQSEFTVHLADVGASKIGVIKAIKEILGLGLKEAKDLVDGAPGDIKAGVKKEEAEEMKAKLEEAGAKVELK
jgi:large subunit ribosomal protein L7/L12